jgi:transcriptional regulator with XRE-family HTH domain
MLERRQAGGRNGLAAQRLRWLRVAEGAKTSSEWAKRIGWSRPQLSNYENGVRLSLDSASTLRNKVHGLTVDWLLFGAENGLSVDLRDRLRAVQEAERAAKPVKQGKAGKPRKVLSKAS